MKKYCPYLVILAFLLIPAFVFAVEVDTAPTTDTLIDDSSNLEDRIVVTLKVRPIGLDRLALKASFYNPYRCTWYGHLFLEREDPSGNFHTIGRRYRTEIPGGTRISGRLIIRRPVDEGPHRFFARAYHPDGGDREPFFNTLLDPSDNGDSSSGDQGSELVISNKVLHSSFDVKIEEDHSDLTDQSPCDDEITATPAPIDVRLSLEPGKRVIKVMTCWKNGSPDLWSGDLYIDVTNPAGGLYIVRRDLGVRIPEGVGFCTYDKTRRPTRPGVYLVTSRALRRDGSDEARWLNPGTTEINAVCNGELCELIEPDQNRAGIELKGRSSIHLVSDFFSEFTRVKMEYLVNTGDGIPLYRSYDITEYCEIRQRWVGSDNHMEVHFNTFRLPIGPRTWAHYTIELHPMPPLPTGSKTSDSLWIFTNGGELSDGVDPGRRGLLGR
jgi:hypothetical protein